MNKKHEAYNSKFIINRHANERMKKREMIQRKIMHQKKYQQREINLKLARYLEQIT